MNPGGLHLDAGASALPAAPVLRSRTMSGIEDELVVALARLKAMLEQPPSPRVLERLVQRRRFVEATRQAMQLRTRYAGDRPGVDPAKSRRIAELDAEVERLQGPGPERR